MQNQPMKRCPQCQNLLYHSAAQCPLCHYVYGSPATPRGSATSQCCACQMPVTIGTRFCPRCGMDQVGFPKPPEPEATNERAAWVVALMGIAGIAFIGGVQGTVIGIGCAIICAIVYSRR